MFLNVVLLQHTNYLDNTSRPTYDAIHRCWHYQDKFLTILLLDHIPYHIDVVHSIFAQCNKERFFYIPRDAPPIRIQP